MTESDFALLWEREVEWLKDLRTAEPEPAPEPYEERESQP